MQQQGQSRKPLLALLLLALLAVGIIGSYVFAGYGQHKGDIVSQRGSTGTIITCSGQAFVAPEYEVGGSLIALAVCLGAFVLYKKYHK